MSEKQKSIGKDAAIALFESKWWIGKSHREIAEFQMHTTELCCPFDVFHGAMEKALGRSIWTHEFAMNFDGLRAELFDGNTAPTFQDILELIPAHKRIVVELP